MTITRRTLSMCAAVVVVACRGERAPAPFEIVAQYPHDKNAYTQGLLRVDSVLFESTGQYGRSELRRVDLKSGRVLASRPLAANQFGEGLALVKDRLYQLTWKSGVAYTYDAATLAPRDSFPYAGEGWGLATDGRSLFMSDGSDSLRVVSPGMFTIERVIHVKYNGAPLYKLNEMEYVNGELLANVYQSNWIVRIDPASGEVRGVLDFADLFPDRPPPAEVMNGIAIAPDSGQLLVTGKLWPTMFQVRLRPRYSVMARKPLWWVIGCGFILGLPVLITGFPALTHDGRVHEVWYTNFAAQFWAGDLYPRWLQRVNMGLGGPTFFFYPPTPFFITSLFQPIFAGQPHSWHALGASVAIALMLSGVAAYAWLRETVDDRSAAIAAILYMVMPYHFAVDIHTRGAFGEVWSFVWMPLILWAAQRLIKRPTLGAAIGLALSYAGLITTHLPTTLLFSVIPPVWVWWTSAPGTRIRTLVWTGLSMALGIGLSAIYLVPAMRDQAFVTMDAMRAGDFHYSKAFFLQRDARGELVLARNIFERGLFWMALATTALGACGAIMAWRGRAERPVRATIFWSVVGAVSVFMMFQSSAPVFELIRPVQLIQFPWRFHAILGLAVIALVAEGLGATANKRDALDVRLLAFGGVLVFQWMLFAVWPLQITSFGANRHLVDPPSAWKAKNTNTPEYRPHWLTAEIAPLQKRLRGTGDTIPKVAVAAGSARVVRWRSRDIVVRVDAPSEERLEVRQFYYPGWSATLDQKTRIAAAPADSSGLIQIPVPAGRHTVELRLEKGPSEVLGDRITGVSFVFVLIIGVAAFFETRRRVSATR